MVMIHLSAFHPDEKHEFNRISLIVALYCRCICGVLRWLVTKKALCMHAVLMVLPFNMYGTYLLLVWI